MGWAGCLVLIEIKMAKVSIAVPPCKLPQSFSLSTKYKWKVSISSLHDVSASGTSQQSVIFLFYVPASNSWASVWVPLTKINEACQVQSCVNRTCVPHQAFIMTFIVTFVFPNSSWVSFPTVSQASPGGSVPLFAVKHPALPWRIKNNNSGLQYARHEGSGCQEPRLDPHVPQKELLSVFSTLLQVINSVNKGLGFYFFAKAHK